jgi:hypothetical protein
VVVVHAVAGAVLDTSTAACTPLTTATGPSAAAAGR